MRTFLYNVTTAIFRAVLPLLAKFSKKLDLFYKGRKNLLNNVGKKLATNKNKVFWVHCSSVGEFEQGLPIIEQIKKENPTWKVAVTFFSPSGYEAVTNSSIDYKFYLPLDTASNASKFIDLIKPELTIFIKYEYWYHYLNQLNLRNIPTYSVSSIFRSTQTFFKWWGSWNRKMLKQFTYFMVQDQSSLGLLNSIGLSNVQITGDTRFDRVLKIKNDTLRFPEIENFIGGNKVFIVGSLRPEDDEIILPFIKSNSGYKFILAPHEITSTHISKIENSIESTVRHSQLDEKSNEKVLIIDSIGKLSRLYRLANIAYVGGGFSDGIHNILEPAVYHIPVFFGNKYYKKYKEATDLVSIQAAFPIANSLDLEEKLKSLQNPDTRTLVCKKIEEYVNSNIGASQKVFDVINQLTKK
jgi:3-deoxy-D-manno-octulosonic-acid transferase